MSLTVLNIGQNHWIRGGSDKYQFDLASLLERHGNRVIPFVARHPDNLSTPWERYFPVAADFESPGLSDILRFIYSRPARASMSKLIGENRVDISHLHIYYGKLTASILSPLKKAGVPIVQTLHDHKVVCPAAILNTGSRICQDCAGTSYWHAVTNRCNRGSLVRSALSAMEAYVSRALGSVDKIDHFIAVSDFLRDKVIELGLPPGRVTTVHHFADFSVTPATIMGEYLLYFGRIERFKGIFTLIEAASKLRGVQLLIAGAGNALAEVRALIESRKLDHIKLLGFQQPHELQELIRGSICTITPTEVYEAFGLTLIESFALGRPVVASRIGGMTEVVKDGDDGFLVTPGSADELREKLSWLVSHRDKAAGMGLRGRKKAQRMFNAEIHYSRLMDVYRKVL